MTRPCSGWGRSSPRKVSLRHRRAQAAAQNAAERCLSSALAEEATSFRAGRRQLTRRRRGRG
eukprot:307924-Chlamydomonas_euryale.AAC.12